MTICLKFENMGKTAGQESKKVHSSVDFDRSLVSLFY